MRKIFYNTLLRLLLLCGFLVNTTAAEHPKGLISSGDLAALRQKAGIAPFKQVVQVMRDHELWLRDNQVSVYDQEGLVRLRTYLYTFTSEEGWAASCYSAIEALSEDTVFLKNPMSFGLTRAALLRSLSQAYDFCYQGWSEQQRVFVADLVFDLMQSVNANMGPLSNNKLESNWMGVRYGSVLFAAIVLNDSLNASMGRRELLNAYKWDTQERLRDHVQASYTPGGWFVESMGYQFYDGSFVWPALIAFQNSLSEGGIQFAEWVPGMLQGYRQNVTGTVAINTGRGMGIKADLADDNPMAGFHGWAFWQRLLPAGNQEAVRWMHRYLLDPEAFRNRSPDLFYSVLYAHDPSDGYNPASGGFLNYCEPGQGVVMFRNQFRDSTDIIATFNTSSKRYKGHAGPDNLTFRLTGLGNIWAVGGGRTGDPTGQTNLFPLEEEIPTGKGWPEGDLDRYRFEGGDGSGYAIGSGSCLGVHRHRRLLLADYSERSGVKAVFVVRDHSLNGAVWRMHTPGFNRVELVADGVMVYAPNGSTLKISVPGMAEPEIHLRSVRYGGSTQRHNPGIFFNGRAWYDNHLIDIHCEREILVVMTLQPAGSAHPGISGHQQSKSIKVGQQRIKLPPLQ